MNKMLDDTANEMIFKIRVQQLYIYFIFIYNIIRVCCVVYYYWTVKAQF